MTDKANFTRATATGNLQSLITNYNANLDALEAALDDSLSLSGKLPNSMTSPLDMNSQRIINLSDAQEDSDAITKRQLDAAVLGNISLSNVNSITFDTTPTDPIAVGRFVWNDQDGTLDLGLKGGNVTLQVGQEQFVRIVNKTGDDFSEAKYQVVKLDGAQGQRMKAVLAQANSVTNAEGTLGLVTETIAINGEGFVTTYGIIRNINTTGSLQSETWADGDTLYLSQATAGKLTNIKPTSGVICKVGYVEHAHSTQGKIFVHVENFAGLQKDTFLQDGAGAVSRNLQDKIRESVSVKDFGAVGDGVTDDTAAIQLAVDYAESISLESGLGGFRPSVVIPAGAYLCGTITVNKRMSFVGDGTSATIIRLKAGITGSVFVLNAENVAGTSIDDTNHYEVRDMSIIGNRIDSVTAGVSSAIECTNAAHSIGTQYSPSLRCNNVVIAGFTGDGVYLGVNRNWAIFDSVIIRYNNKSGCAAYSYDNRFTSCDFGVNAQYGFRAYAGGANSFVGCNFYYNVYNFLANNECNAPNWFINCAIDYAYEHGAYFGDSNVKDAHSFVGCRFYGNGQNAANTYSDVYLAGTDGVSIVGCQFILGQQTTKYLVESIGGITNIAWSSNTYDTISPPYGTAVTNNFSLLNAAHNFLTNIKFPSTQVSSSDVNVLDDYEEGTWTPTVVSSGGGEATYVSQNGVYTKIGNSVTVHFKVQISAHSGSGTMSIGGLPFQSANVTNITPIASLMPILLDVPASSSLIGVVQTNSQSIGLYSVTTTGGYLSDLALDTNFVLSGSVTYQTA